VRRLIWGVFGGWEISRLTTLSKGPATTVNIGNVDYNYDGLFVDKPPSRVAVLEAQILRGVMYAMVSTTILLLALVARAIGERLHAPSPIRLAR
jgi:hypothetical protein